jgi:hypothetical protein
VAQLLPILCCEVGCMTREELFAVMRGIVLDVTGVTECILDDQNATAPTGEYCVIEPFSNIRHIGRGSVKQTEVDAVDELDFNDIEEELTTLLEARVDVNFFRGDARLHAQKLMFSDQRSDVYTTLFSNGVFWMRTDAVNNLTVLNSAQYETRAQISIYVQFEQTQTNTVQQIYNVPFEIENESGNVLTTGEEIIDNP